MISAHIDEIETLIRARYPILYILSGEESRVLEALLEIGTRRRKTVLEWGCNTGLIAAGISIQSKQSRDAGTKEPLAALDRAIEQVDPAILSSRIFIRSLQKVTAPSFVG